jgi:hypothetical protein
MSEMKGEMLIFQVRYEVLYAEEYVYEVFVEVTYLYL